MWEATEGKMERGGPLKSTAGKVNVSEVPFCDVGGGEEDEVLMGGVDGILGMFDGLGDAGGRKKER